MHLYTILTALVAATSVSAAPSDSPMDKKAVLASGSNQNGSIFMFGSSRKCRQVFYTGGACGLSTYFADKVDPNLPLVAVPSGVFDKFGQAQHNQLCGKVVTMTYQGVTRQAIVADRNVSNERSIDMCLGIWKAFGGKDGDGSIRKGIQWSIDA
ncbi:hypothetical protein FBEOM_8871 [Fusarium beomiforme]|uniref:Ecp2 effector protein domain-containing protein n=1 Tax=Fusarium beomiforme TaxID=44412 RepID=A0A9P5AG06_9HYPO|nr:hypothetical protein FBEOM_8871 [Fusarium beomiforme]